MQILSDNTFEQEVLKSNLPVVVDFWAEWCGPCKMLMPVLEGVALELEGKVKIAKLNVDQNSETASKYGVRSLPTLLLYKEGKVVSNMVGVNSKEKILEWVGSNA
jgi:thioredoxin 1